MGFFQDVGRTFGLTKSKAQGDAPARREMTTPLQTKIGKELAKTLRDKIAGIDTGFSKDLIDPAVASFAKRQRRDLEEITVPGISAGASGRGVGRSTIPVGITARERGRTGESIAERIANLGLSSEQLRAKQVSEATGRFQRLTETEVAALNAETQAANLFDNAEFLRQQGFREKADAAQQQGLKLLMSTAAGAVTGGAGLLPGVAGGVGGALLGGAAGMQGDLTAFSPSSGGLLSGANIFPRGETPDATVKLIDDVASAFGISKEKAEQMIEEEKQNLQRLD